MKTKEITLCGKTVSLAYCYATEIGFNSLAGIPIFQLDATNPSHVISYIMAAILAYAEAKKAEAPITTDDLIFHAEPAELAKASEAVAELQKEWYNIPAGEPKDEEGEKKEDEQKNA